MFAGPEDDAINLVRRLLLAEGARDLRTIYALLDPEVVFEMPFAPSGFSTIHGRSALLDLLASFIDADVGTYVVWSLDVSALHLVSPGELVFAEYSAEAQTRTGAAYQQNYVAKFGIRDGRIASWREWFNPLPLDSRLPNG
ncbi:MULTISPECIES: nuclear transport factor 2 family protein [Mycolicibacterium]|uniref:nuclear transport factor 2 family protein n=1 Tax=Mycolicibacterium TaxID=1866885 RepID=UPI0006CAC260|nr:MULTISPECIES: nuclear transport factor 2 family protein [Mycolicibacterium]QZT58547.1 nuclear transport factor 2 family protein [Mycolicibacterium austroafricanum]